MKTNPLDPKRRSSCIGLSAIAAIALVCSSQVAVCEDLNVNSFDSDVSGIAWQNWRSYVSDHTIDWDGLQDADGNANSGSMYVTVNWPLATDPTWNTGWNDVQVAFGTTTFAATNYIELEAFIKIDVAKSFTAADGTYGVAGLYVNGGDGSWQQVQGYATLTGTGDWQRIHGSFSAIPNKTYSEVVIGLISNGGSSPTNTIAYWIDNVRLTAPPSANTNQPPLSIAQAPPAGLTCIASAPDDAWQRQMVRTAFSNYSWDTSTASSNTTTYSMSIAAFPSAAHNGFEAMMYLIPVAGMPNGPDDPSVDWNSSDVVYFTIRADATGAAEANFRYKVSDPGAEHFQSSTNLPCAAGPLGKWSLGFYNNTNVTITAPTGDNVTFNISADDAATLGSPLFAYFGVRPADAARIGQAATFSRIQITGAVASIDDTFVSQGPPYQLDSNTWIRKASHPPGIFITAPDAKCWVSWPTPDGGFTNLYATDDLTKNLQGSEWKTIPAAATGWVLVGGNKRLAVINQSALNTAFGYTPTNCFFGLWHIEP
jgi:hypothetical protein